MPCAGWVAPSEPLHPGPLPAHTALHAAPKLQNCPPAETLTLTLVQPCLPAVWEVVAGGAELYPGLTAMQVILQVSQHEQRPETPQDCPPALKDLMQRCWSHNAAQRCASAAMCGGCSSCVSACACAVARA